MLWKRTIFHRFRIFEEIARRMKSAILTSDSNKNLEILIELADRLGIKTKILTEEQLEDIGLIKAIKNGRTGSFVDTDKFISGLK